MKPCPEAWVARAVSVKPHPRPPTPCVRPRVVAVTAGKSRTGRGSCARGKRRRKRGEGERMGKKRMEIVLWGLGLGAASRNGCQREDLCARVGALLKLCFQPKHVYLAMGAQVGTLLELL